MKLGFEYLAGLIDGEGSFNIGVRVQKRQIPYEFIPLLIIASTNKEIVESTKDTFLCGIIYQPHRNKVHNKWKPIYYYEICSEKDALKSIPLLDKCPFIIKANEYKLWKEVVLLLNLKEHRTKSGVNKILKLKWEIEDHRTPKNRVVYRLVSDRDFRPRKLPSYRYAYRHRKKIAIPINQLKLFANV